ncbi:transglutaminase-like domain-containing protein [uncultured Paraglaciecola sp.]|uniref:transglutaminase-like domain-containing protein n=1 Tax=uncultured Paraglaciecola sp. TaxID=1765024 RepID=UPI00259177EC|nr:transglutaminase-like domain-containing protein [uncultured Paraglaciecola sp.]
MTNITQKTESYRFSMPLLAGQRALLKYDVSGGSKVKVFKDASGSYRLDFESENIAPYSIQEIQVSWSLSNSDSAQVPVSKLLANNSQAERFIESDNLQVLNLATRLNKNGDLQNVQKIYNWVSENIKRADYSGKIYGAVWALKNYRGDCTEQALLFVALARALGVPSRVMGGYIMERSGRVFAKDFHNWAEAYVQGKWIIIDPYYGVFDDGYEKYIATQVLDFSSPDADNRRFWIKGGKGLKVTMQ